MSAVSFASLLKLSSVVSNSVMLSPELFAIELALLYFEFSPKAI